MRLLPEANRHVTDEEIMGATGWTAEQLPEKLKLMGNGKLPEKDLVVLNAIDDDLFAGVFVRAMQAVGDPGYREQEPRQFG